MTKIMLIELCWACKHHKYTNSGGYRSLKCLVACIQIECGAPGQGPLSGEIPDWCLLQDAGEYVAAHVAAIDAPEDAPETVLA